MNLHKTLGIKYPFIQGGMANISTGAFAAAASNAGGLGIVASGGWDAEKMREEIRICKSLTDKPFGANLMLMNPDTPAIAKMLAEEGVKLITTGAGNPSAHIPMWKEAGILVFPVIPATIMAKMMARSAIDGLIAEGTESGGHVGEVTTMALVPQVVDCVNLPVIAAGGIADGRQVAAAAALGAVGVQLGTLLLASEECPIHDNYKQALVKAKESDTVVTGRSSGAPVRVLRNKMSKEYLRMEKDNLPREEMEMLTLGSLRRAVLDGDVEMGSLMSGQVAGMVKGVRPLAEIFEDLWQGYLACVKGLAHDET